MDALNLLPSPPLASELWWVAVDGANDMSGGWWVLASPGIEGARIIEKTLSQAGVAFLAAASLDDLEQSLSHCSSGSTLSFCISGGRMVVRNHDRSSAQVLADLRLSAPIDRIILVEDCAPVQDLARRLRHLVETQSFMGVRLDLRPAPRGQGAWGLALAGSQ